jgi:hypothetical protein
MRKYLSLFLILIFAVQVHAASVVSGRPCPGGSAAVAVHCAGSCTTDDADQFCVDSEEGTASSCLGDAVKGENSTIAYNVAPNTYGTLSCADKGSYSIVIDNKDTETTHLYKDLGGTRATLSGQFYFLLHSHSLGNNESVRLFRSTLDGSVTSIIISVQNVSGTALKLSYALNQTSDLVGNSTTTISLDTWYRVRFYFIDESTFRISLALSDGSSSETVVDNTSTVSGSVVGRYVTIGGTQGTASVADYVVQFDNIKIDDDTEITTGCTQ